MDLPFLLIALVIVVTAAGAVALPKDIHCGLCAALSFFAIGVLYLHLGALFLGWMQLMVYVGAIAVLLLFTILLTRPMPEAGEPPPLHRRSFWHGALVAMAVTAALVVCVNAFTAPNAPAEAPVLTIESIGLQLMSRQVLALEVTGLLLTAALIGAVVLAAPEPGKKP